MNFCFDSSEIAARLAATHTSKVDQSADQADSEASGNSSYFYGIPLKKSGDIATHLSCAEILELQKEVGQLKFAAVTSRDIKKNSPFQRIYVSTVEAQTKQNTYPEGIRGRSDMTRTLGIPPDSQDEQFIPSQLTFSRDIKQMIQGDQYQLERKAVVHLDGRIKNAKLSPSERHALIQGENEVHFWSCDDLGDWREEGVFRSKNIEKATFSPSGHYGLAAAEGLCKVWCFEEGGNWVEQAKINYSGCVSSICFSPTERALVITSSSDNHHDTFAIHVCNGNGGWVPGCLISGYQDLSFEFSPGGNDVLVTSKTGAALLNISADGRVGSQYSFDSHGNRVEAAFSKAGHHAVIFTESDKPRENNQLRIIGRVGDKWQEMGSFNYFGHIWEAKFSESARHLIIETYDGKIRIWSRNNEGRYVQTEVVSGDPSRIKWEFSALEDLILIYDDKNNFVQILEYDSEGRWRKVHANSYYYLERACFSAIPEANCIMIQTRNAVHVLHDINKVNTQFKTINTQKSFEGVNISPSGRYVLTTDSEDEGLSARIWGFDSEGNSIAKASIYCPAFAIGTFNIDKVVFSASEQMLRLHCRDGLSRQHSIILWGCDDNGLWTERGVIENVSEEPIQSHAMLQIMAFDQDKASEFKIYGYDSSGHWHQKAAGSHGASRVRTGSLSSSGRILLTCGDDNNVSIWNIDAPEK